MTHLTKEGRPPFSASSPESELLSDPVVPAYEA